MNEKHLFSSPRSGSKNHEKIIKCERLFKCFDVMINYADHNRERETALCLVLAII